MKLTPNTRRFHPGEAILYRELDERQRITSVLPVRVVRDDPSFVILWLPLGTPSIKPELVHHTPGTPRRWVEGNWCLTRSTWQWAELLILVRPDEHRATWAAIPGALPNLVSTGRSRLSFRKPPCQNGALMT